MKTTEQEVRIVIDVSVTMAAGESTAVKRKVEAAARAFMRGKAKKFHVLKFADAERLREHGDTEFTSLLLPEPPPVTP